MKSFKSGCFSINTHIKNMSEDYSVSCDTDKFNLCIICDGCSSSIDTDVGSRLISLSLKNIFNGYNFKNYIERLSDKKLLDINTYVLDALYNSLSMSSEYKLGISEKSLFCTICVLIRIDNFYHIFFYGDGVYAIEYLDGKIDAHELYYQENAPRYPIYNILESTLANYENNFPNNKLIKRNLINGEEKEVELISHLKYFHECVDVENVKQVSIFSDGVTSFIDGKNNKLDALNMINYFIDYKTLGGNFVKRTAMFTLNSMQKLSGGSVKHHDDFSIATIISKEEESNQDV